VSWSLWFKIAEISTRPATTSRPTLSIKAHSRSSAWAEGATHIFAMIRAGFPDHDAVVY
jgi:hypothetical protein